MAQNLIAATEISNRTFEQLKNRAVEEGTTPEAILDKALAEFIEQNK